MSDWLSHEQILGYLASVILLAGYAIKSDEKTKIVLIFSSVIFAAHFFLLHAFTAAIICVINALRNGSSLFFYGSRKIFIIFLSLYLFSGYLTYNVFIDLLPLMAATLTCFGMFLLSGIKFRMLVVLATLLWIIHNAYVGSVGGTINSVILFFISVSTVVRLQIENKKNA